MTINHHPLPDHLMSYAAGTMSEAASVLIASHLTLCPHCRAETRRMEEVGGALLDALPASPVGGLAHVLKRLDQEPNQTPATPGTARADGDAAMLPRPLLNYVGQARDGQLPWRRFLGVEQISLKTSGRAWSGAHGRLLRIPSGGGLPYHGHAGDELVLVLSGGFRDEIGTYHRGDVATADPMLVHTPRVVPGEPCVCMTVNDGPILPGRILAPLARLFRRGDG